MQTYFQTPGPTLQIRHVRVFDGERVLEQRSVLVENGIISGITEPDLHIQHAEVIDGRGRTLLPGLFDAHVHLADNPEPALRQAISLGVTTVLDMFNGTNLLEAKQRLVAEDPADLADLRTAGYGAIAPGSLLAKLFTDPLPTITSPEQAPAWVDTRLAEGSDYIKIVYDEREGGDLSQEVVRALVQAAHQRGKLVVVHVLAEQKAREAIAAGADGLAHLFLGEDASLDFGQFAAAHHVFVIPTLMILAGLCGNPQGPALLADSSLAPYITAGQRQAPMRPADPGRHHLYQATVSAMQQLLEAQVPLLAGTDTGPPTAALGVTGYGAALHGELKLLVDAGMTPVQALAAATSVPARIFHFTDRGLIRSGMRADLVLVEGNPTQDILATRNIVAVWKRGVQVQRQRGEATEEVDK
jgi:imidazolonepropionase-like amidohydrolase